MYRAPKPTRGRFKQLQPDGETGDLSSVYLTWRGAVGTLDHLPRHANRVSWRAHRALQLMVLRPAHVLRCYYCFLYALVCLCFNVIADLCPLGVLEHLYFAQLVASCLS
jgi:hypothetical protein